MNLTTIEIVLFAAAGQGVLLSVVLLTSRRGNKSANRLLATLVLLFSVMLFFHSLGEMQGAQLRKDSDEEFSQAIFALFAPLLYFYSRSLTRPPSNLRLADGIHLLPFGLIIVVFVLSPFSPNHPTVRTVSNALLPWLFLGQMTAYLTVILIQLFLHRKRIEARYSSLAHINLRWLSFLVMAQLFIWPVAFFTEITGGDSKRWNTVWLLVSAMIYAMGYFGLRQPGIFVGEYEEDINSGETTKRKYEKSVLTKEEAERIASRLQELMDSEKAYLRSTLSLPELAQKTGISVHHISQVLNEKIGKSFFDYVNSMRVDEARRMLRDPSKKHLSIAAIGFEAGFNSLSTFNSVFRKFTKTTPSRYQERR